jgi:hypothetical protein
MMSEIEIILESNINEEKEYTTIMDPIICEYCSKGFCNKMTLLCHQTTTKNCLKLHVYLEVTIDCVNCKKSLALEYYKQHEIKCDIILQKSKTEEKQELDEIQKQTKKLYKDFHESKDINDKLKIELTEARIAITLLERQNDRLHSSFDKCYDEVIRKS